VRGKVVAITGGARGIGLSTATVLAAAGATVALGDLDGDLAATRAAQLDAVGLPLDVRDEASFSEFLTTVEQRLGPIDILVNNAGVAMAGHFADTSAAQHGLQLAVNLGGVLRGTRLALPPMVARGEGRIVNIASAAGRIPAPGAAVYTATKHGVVGLTEALRGELRDSGVYVTAILPTFVRTEMASGLRLPGIPQVNPDTVARTVLRVLRRSRPPVTVMVPRWLRAVALIDAASPQWLRDLVRTVNPVDGQVDHAARAAYEARVNRQL
jgi:NAD(P)-dependent dehydrogenase (short-subunit alcohol dehydrogenase family)